jgi:putative endonuclease
MIIKNLKRYIKYLFIYDKYYIVYIIMNDYIVYLLKNTENKYTYLGITNNSERRIRQHNNIIKGGAKYTHAKKGDGEWIYHLKINNLTKSEALSMERTAKNLRKKAKGKTPLDRRLDVLLPLVDKYEDANVIYH